jgi:hypothetical protein
MRILRNALRAYVRNSRIFATCTDKLASLIEAERIAGEHVHYRDWDERRWGPWPNIRKSISVKRDLCKHLKQWPGLTLLGEGGCGIVVQEGKFALKLCYEGDKGYEMFIRFCREFGRSRYLPRFEDIITIRGLTVYCLEKLEPYSEGNEHNCIQTLYQGLRGYPDATPSIFDSELVRVIKAMQTFGAANYRIEDMCRSNFMLRGNQIVITDPWR